MPAEKSLAYNTAHNSAIIRVLHTPTYIIIIVYRIVVF